MGADAFVAFVGVRYTLADDELDAVERETDARVVAAANGHLQTHFGRMTDGEPYFLFVGTRLGWLGVEHDTEIAIDAQDLAQIVSHTQEKLRAAGIGEPPRLYLQLVAQY